MDSKILKGKKAALANRYDIWPGQTRAFGCRGCRSFAEPRRRNMTFITACVFYQNFTNFPEG